MTIKNKIAAAFLMIMVLTLGIFAGSLLNTGEKALATAPGTSNPDQKLVSVQGEGIINVTPDVAYVTLGVETSNKEMAAAQAENKVKMNAIMAELKRLGIAEKDIKTTNYSVYPDYQWQQEKSVLVGYRVNNQVRVKIIKIDDTGKILDAVAAKGANTVNGIEFTVADGSKAYQDALKLALKNAKEKAMIMVGEFGYSNVTPVTIVEGSQAYTPQISYDSVKLAEAAGQTPVSSGQMEIRAQVNVSFEFK
jgi:uncharacterized protein YggE